MENNEQEIKLKKRRIPGKREVVSVANLPVEKIEIPEQIIKEIAEIADETNVQIYLVGGYVRDYFLKRMRNDYDFTVIGDAISFAQELAKRFKSKALVYDRFRTAMVPIDGIKCEFVGTRKEEYYEESRNPQVEEGTLDDDLRRRDFTINSLAAGINKDNYGIIIDLFHGKRDLDKRLLRTPLNPLTTLNEDPLRMMRAARFAAQLGFSVADDLFKSMKTLAHRIDIISQERITEELMKILASKVPSIGLKILNNTGILELIFPEIGELSGVETVEVSDRMYGHKDVLLHTFKVVDKVAQESDNIWLRFAALVHDIAKPKTKKYIPGTGWTFHGHEELGARWMERIFRQLKLPMEPLDYVETLVRLHQRPMALVDDGVTESAVRRLAFLAGDALADLFLLCRADITTTNPQLSERYLNNYEIVFEKVLDVQDKDKLREFQSPVRGDEIMEVTGLEPSRAVGFIKSWIEEAILDGLIPNEHEPARAYFLEHKDEWMENINSLTS
ncbi:MAG: poly(A) polymerase [Bacteroidota bacterium]|nr:poly(A) polymerase [Bacteroidota bacterium]